MLGRERTCQRVELMFGSRLESIRTSDHIHAWISIQDGEGVILDAVKVEDKVVDVYTGGIGLLWAPRRHLAPFRPPIATVSATTALT